MGFGEPGGAGGPQPPEGVFALFCRGVSDFEGSYGPSFRWHFDVFNVDGTPAIDPESGEQYTLEPLSSQSRGLNTTTKQWAKAVQWAAALMGKADPAEIESLSGAELDAGITEAWATGVIGKNAAGYATLEALYPYGTEVGAVASAAAVPPALGTPPAPAATPPAPAATPPAPAAAPPAPVAPEVQVPF